MMKILFNILCGLMAIAMTACTQEQLVVEGQNPDDQGEKVNVKAYAPGNDNAGSRITFQENEGNEPTVSLSWSKEERFSVVRGSDVRTFSKNTAGNTFMGTLPTDGTGDYLAFYPATASADLPVDLSVQTGALDSKLTYMYATSTDGMVYEFQHCVSLLKVAFVGLPQGATIKQIIVNTVGPKVDGKFNPSNPTDFGGTKKTITINNSAAEDIYIYLPPIPVAQKTLYFEVTTSDDKVYKGTMTSTSNKPIEAGKLYTGSVKMSEVVIPYITFEAASTQTFKMSRGYEKLEYSLDNGKSWSALSSAEVSFGAGKKLLLRGKSSVGTNGGTISFGDKSVKVACSGDIRTLVDYENYATVSTASASFKSLFEDCSQLTSAPDLPATELAQECYRFMFYSCTSLVNAPVLPATKLTERCYQFMLYGCTSLKTAPELPAETMVEGCYSSMFSKCTSLVTAPVLPAMKMAKDCYSSMFSDCTSLVTAPELPAMYLHDFCYASMFAGCTKLTVAPELPAMNVPQNCYNGMFENCIQLTSAPELPATDIYFSSYERMFSGCKSLKKAPALPATKLYGGCYAWMFAGCTSLKVAPELPAEELDGSCYVGMFESCTSLTEAPDLPAQNLSDWCYAYMFQNCHYLVRAPELPATTLAEYCYYGMFCGCSRLVQAPELLAPILVPNCYEQMFSYCSSLNSVTMMATDISATGCLDSWLLRVASTGTFTKSASATWDEKDIIPAGWTVIAQ